MKAYNLFTGKTDDAMLTASDGTAAGVSETLNGISCGRVIVSVINPNGANVQMMHSHNRLPYSWAPLGDSTDKSIQNPIILQSDGAYHFESDGAGVEVYVREATPSVVYDGTESAGVG